MHIYNICIMDIPEGEDKDKEIERTLKAAVAVNYPNVVREMDIQIHGVQRLQIGWTHMKKRSEVLAAQHVQFFATPWTVGHQAPLFVEFSRQEYWSGLPLPSSEDLPYLRVKPGSDHQGIPI